MNIEEFGFLCRERHGSQPARRPFCSLITGN